MQTQIRSEKCHGGALPSASDIDFGHDDMTLQDLQSDEAAKIAKLTEEEVLCLRLYTSSSFICFNRPLRLQTRPYPSALSVAYLTTVEEAQCCPGEAGPSWAYGSEDALPRHEKHGPG
eukprot:1107702-Rhodomonas_salina.2